MKIGIQPLLPIGNFLNKRYSIEMDFSDDSNPADNFKYLNDIVTAIHMKEYPLCYKEGKPVFSNYQGEEEVVKKEAVNISQEIQSTLDAINSCTEIDGKDGLKSFWLTSKTNLILSKEYKLKLKQLEDAGNKK